MWQSEDIAQREINGTLNIVCTKKISFHLMLKNPAQVL